MDVLAGQPAGREAVGQFSVVAGINETGGRNGRTAGGAFSWLVFLGTTQTMTSICEQFPHST